MSTKQPTICGLCHENLSKYKCPACSTPYCSLTCYKPHKLTHSLEPALPPEVKIEAPPPPKEKKHKFAPLLASPEITARLQSKTLQTHLLNVYHASLRPSDEEMERRQRSKLRGSRRGRGRGRGRGGDLGGRGGGVATVTWTQEKGDKAALARLKRLRTGGTAENIEVEEFVKLVVSALDK